MKLISQAALIVLIAILGAVFIEKLYPWDSEDCDSEKLSLGEFCATEVDLAQRILWVDARSEEQWESNGIKGAYHLDPGSMNDERKLEALLEPLVSAEVVYVYCGGSECADSKTVRTFLLGLELNQNIKVIFGGYPSLRKELSELF